MLKKLPSPSWTLGDMIITLIIVFTTSYGLGTLLKPFLNENLSLAGRFLVAGIIQTSMFLITVFLIVLFRSGGYFNHLGLTRNTSMKNLKKGFTGGLLLFIIVLASGIMVSTLFPNEPKPQPFAELLLEAKTPFEVFVPFVMGGFFAPLGEEIYFRGFAYLVLREKFGVVMGIIITSIFFSALHFDVVRFIPLTLGGAGLAWLYETTGSLLTPIIAHSVWNVSMLALMYFASKGAALIA